jgi:hypothetical protein
MYTIFGLFAGEKNPFSVKIDESQSVDDLMKAIKKKNSVTLAGVDAKNLMVYHFNLEPDKSDKQKLITQASEISKDLSKYKPLSPLRELSTIEEGFPKGILHILVQSESIDSRTCGAVPETML